MSLLDEIAANTPRPVSTPCTVSGILARLPPTDADELRAAFTDPNVTVSGIFRALKGRGFTVTEGTLARHRRADCKCPR